MSPHSASILSQLPQQSKQLNQSHQENNHPSSLSESKNIESTTIIHRQNDRKRRECKMESPKSDHFIVPLKKRARRFSPRSKRRLTSISAKYSPEALSHYGKVSSRSRSPHRVHLLVGRASDYKNTSPTFRPISPNSTLKVTQSRHSTGKRRTGLVKRTHSPVTELSPISRPFITTRVVGQKVKSILAIPAVSDGVDKKHSQNKIKLYEKLNMRRTSRNTHLTRRMSRISRSHSPCTGRRTLKGDQRSFGEETALPSYVANKSGVTDVRMISPTLRGIYEAARIIRSPTNSMLSFPTEIMYTSSCFVPFNRPSKLLDDSTGLVRTNGLDLFDSFNLCDEQLNSAVKKFDGPFLLLHSPSQARHFMSVSKPKTFLYKHLNSKPLDNQKENPIELRNCLLSNAKERSYTAVTFSESMEVFSRLARAFWPGPVKIFAPVRMRTSKKDANANIDKRSNPDKPVLPKAMGHDVGCNKGSNKAARDTNNRENHLDAIPIFPTSTLAAHSSLFGSQSTGKTPYFVGFRCPSHPLAKRILTEAYTGKSLKGNKADHKVNEGKKLHGAIFGSTSSADQSKFQPKSAMEVCSHIISLSHHQSVEEVDKPIVYVLNGEDKREIFHVPACQFSNSESISLVINTLDRTVNIIREDYFSMVKGCSAKVGTISSLDITAEHVKQAIQVCKNDEDNQKVVASVMRRWKVCEIPTRRS